MEMKSVVISFRLYRFSYRKRLLSRMALFQTLQDSLRDYDQKLFRQPGYPQVYTIIDIILVILRSLGAWIHEQQPLIDNLNAFVKPSDRS